MAGLFAAGVVLLNPPVLNLVGGTVFGWPALYVYIFAVWAALILGAALVVESGAPEDRDKDGDRDGGRQ